MTIRERITEETRDAKTQVDMDRIWYADNQRFAKMLLADFPGQASEIMYEWNCRKMQIKKMV